MTRRLYSASDIRMLTACDVIADHALENLEAITAYNPEWNEVYFTAIKTEIAGVLQSVFGIRSVNTLKEITARLNEKQAKMLDHLTMLHRQISSAWRSDPVRLRAILTAFGYTTYWASAKTNGSITALITLLETAAKATTNGLIDEMKAKKISTVSLNYVANNARKLYELNVEQEGTKDARKLITAEIIARFNTIYTDTMFYAGTAQILFKSDPVRVKEFTFSHIIRRLGGGRSNTTPGTSDDVSGNLGNAFNTFGNTSAQPE